MLGHALEPITGLPGRPAFMSGAHSQVVFTVGTTRRVPVYALHSLSLTQRILVLINAFFQSSTKHADEQTVTAAIKLASA